MKKFMLTIALTTTFFSCSNDDVESTEINGRYIHQISNCDDIVAEEKSCTEAVEFIGNEKALIIFGGNDVGYDVNYQVNGRNIQFTYTNGNEVELSFTIQNENTLIRIEDNATWIRE